MEIDNISFNDLVVPKKEQDKSYEEYLERIVSRLQNETIERLVKEFNSIKRKKGEHYLVFDYLRDQYLIANKSYWYEYVHYYDKKKLGDKLEELIKEKYLDKTIIRGIIYSSDIETLNYFRKRFEPKKEFKPSGTYLFVMDTILFAFDLINANKIRKITAIGDENFNFSDIKVEVIDQYCKESYKYLFSILRTEKLQELMLQIGLEKEATYGILWLIDAIGNEIFRREPERIFAYLDKENYSYEDFLECESSHIQNGISFRQIILAHYLKKQTLVEFLDKLKNEGSSLINRSKIYLFEKILHQYDNKTLTGKRFDLFDKTMCFEDLLLNEKLENCINKVVQIYDFLKFLPNEILEPLLNEALKNQHSPIRERRLLANRILAEYIRRNPTAERDGNLTHPFLKDIKVDDLLYDANSFDLTSYCMVRLKLIDYLDHIQISKLLEELDNRKEKDEIEKLYFELLKINLNKKLEYLNKLYLKEHEGEITFNNLVFENYKTSKFTNHDQDHIIAALTTQKIESMLDESRLIEIKSDAKKKLISKLHAEYRIRNLDVYKASYLNRSLYLTTRDLAADKKQLDKYNYKDERNMFNAITSLDPDFDFSNYFYLEAEARNQLFHLTRKYEYCYENRGFKVDLFLLRKLKTCTVSDIVDSEIYDFAALVSKFNIRKINKLLKELDCISEERELTQLESLLKRMLDYEQKQRKEDEQFSYQNTYDDEFKADEFNEIVFLREQMSVQDALMLDIEYLKFLEEIIEEKSKGKKKQKYSKVELRQDYLKQHSLLNKSIDGPFDFYLYPYAPWKEELLVEPLDYFAMHKQYLKIIKENKDPSSVLNDMNV